MSVLVDSSVWIAAQSVKNKECLQLKRLIKNRESVFVALPIQAEVCQGARGETEFRKLWDAFLGFPFLELTDIHWHLSAANYFNCRKKGVTPTTLDCLIATLAKQYDVPLWSLDKNIERMRPIIGFDIYHPK
ncbi:MAG: type II toxin-antitoxin system VapC family toxin [Pseudobdellovibrionaceae bacterium]